MLETLRFLYKDSYFRTKNKLSLLILGSDKNQSSLFSREERKAYLWFSLLTSPLYLPMMIKKILVPTDFSQIAKGAFTYALHLAAHFGAKLQVLHIYRGDFGVPVPEVMAYQMLESRRKHAENLLRAFVQGLSEVDQALLDASDVELRQEMGLAVDTILEVAEDEDYDLVVMGTKGEHNFAEHVFGSITTNVLRSSPCPVIAVPEGAEFAGFNRLVYAVDLSKSSLRNMENAEAWANGLNAELALLHVSSSPEEELRKDSIWKQLKEEKQEGFHNIEAASLSEGLGEFVQDYPAQIVCMVHQKRGWLERLFHNSQTQKIALATSLPLLILQGK